MDANCVPLRGPQFSTYAPDEVGWLVTDLARTTIHGGDERLRKALGDEYRPPIDHVARTLALMRSSARQIAGLVATVAESALAERGPGLVLASTARAGVPAGILMRRWIAYAHRISVDHYAIGVSRGNGVDPAALQWLAANHDPARVLFVDAWTGKGGVAKELRSCLTRPGAPQGFSPTLAVLTDPGHCADIFGTRMDVLVPIACVNSTVTGLVSGAVPHPGDNGSGGFFVARFFREYRSADLSRTFLDIVSAGFPSARPIAPGRQDAGADAGLTPDWTGWKATERVARRYGIEDMNLLVRPGVGETLRVLLSQVPRRVLVNPAGGGELDIVRRLAEARGVPVEEVPGLPYVCMGLVRDPSEWRAANDDDHAASVG